ncbi:hypothetical protein GCM10009069_26290 [Algimonas arctica]|uniref:BLUF domain-containing protein n=1 Tax=Algimonas arctica TaxID=1479486 RepID=A0A8J3CRQ4_9PROT|nr:hypothetical protein GCM10009069_26290 [Algimonas arctica]
MQYIYSSICTDKMTGDKGVLISIKSVEICERLGLTGRVFSNRTHTFAITEGPEMLVQHYYNAVKADPLVETMVLHGQRTIAAREFDDYSVWLDINHPFDPHPQVHPMTAGSLARAMPDVPSVRLRVMVDAFFDAGRLVAQARR